MDKEYGYEVCPLDSNKPCFDYDRLGTLACGLCGANKENAEEGRTNLLRGLSKNL